MRSEDASSQLVAALKTEKEELEASVARQQTQNVQLRQEVSEAETGNIELTKASSVTTVFLFPYDSWCVKASITFF